MTITHDTDLMPIGKQVAFWRKKRNLGRSDLANKIGLTYMGIYKIEEGEVKPTKETLDKICEALKLQYDPLILREK